MFDQKRARKKKSLTDPVAIIPYAGQSLRNEPTKPVNKPSVPQERPAFNIKKEAKTLSAPTGQLQTTHLSINKLIEQQKEKAHVSSDNLPRKPFERDDLIPLWKTIAHAQKLNGQDQVFHIMTKRDPQQIDPTHYQLEVDSEMQKTRMDNAMGEIMTRLREELQNYDLEIAIEVTRDEIEETKFLTGTDKFEKMAKKNSNLFDFKNRFNLDIDY